MFPLPLFFIFSNFSWSVKVSVWLSAPTHAPVSKCHQWEITVFVHKLNSCLCTSYVSEMVLRWDEMLPNYVYSWCFFSHKKLNRPCSHRKTALFFHLWHKDATSAGIKHRSHMLTTERCFMTASCFITKRNTHFKHANTFSASFLHQLTHFNETKKTSSAKVNRNIWVNKYTGKNKSVWIVTPSHIIKL